MFICTEKCYKFVLINFKFKLNMKKVLLSAVALLAFGFANAQEGNGNGGFSKGSMFV